MNSSSVIQVYKEEPGGTAKQEQDLNQLLKVRRDKLADLQANGKKTHFRSQV